MGEIDTSGENNFCPPGKRAAGDDEPHAMVAAEGCMRAAPVWLLVSVLGGCPSVTEGPVSRPPDAPPPVVGVDAPNGVTADAPIVTTPPDAAAGVIFDPCVANPSSGY